MKRFSLFIMCMAILLLTACAGRQPKLTDAEAAALLPRPFIMELYGKSFVIKNFQDFSRVMKPRPRAFITYVAERQYNSAYHLHLRSLFTEMGYTPEAEGFIEIGGTPTQQPELKPVPRKKGKKHTPAVPVPVKKRYYKQTFFWNNTPIPMNMQRQHMNDGNGYYQDNNQSNGFWGWLG